MGKKSKNPKKNKKANTKASAAEGATEKSSTSNGMNSDSTNVNTTGDAEVHVDVDCDVDVPVTNDADDQVDQTKGGDNGDDVEGIKADVSDAITNEDNEIVEEDAQQAPETDPEPEAVEPQPEPLAAEIEEPEEETPAVLEDSDPATGFISEIETDAEDETAEDDNSLTAPAPEPEEHEPAPVEQDADDVDAQPKAPTEDSPPVPAEIEPIAADEKGEPEEQIDGPRPIVIAGPSGAGKGTLISILMERYPDKQFGFSVSHTTRQPRSGEINTVHYNFTTVDSMKSEIDDGKFIEYAEVHGNYYGTSIEAVQSVTQKGQVCILDIDIQGVQLVKESKLNPYYIFIAPPSMEHLEKRLRGRGTEKEEDIQKRLANAKGEMDYGQVEGNFDMYLVNNDLNVASDELCGTVASWFPHLKRAEVETETEVDEVVTGAGQGVVPEDEADPKDSETNTEVMDNVSPDPVNVEESLEFPEDEVDDSVLESEKVTVVAELETQPSPEPEPEPEPEPVAVTEEVQDKGALDIEVSTEEIATTPEPKNPEPAVEVSTEPPAVEEIEKTSDEIVEIKSDPQDKPEKQEVTNATNSEPVTATKEVVNPNAKGIHYSLEELMFPIEGVDWAQRQAYLSDDDFQQHFGMTQSEFNALPKWKKQAAKKKVGIF